MIEVKIKYKREIIKHFYHIYFFLFIKNIKLLFNIIYLFILYVNFLKNFISHILRNVLLRNADSLMQGIQEY